MASTDARQRIRVLGAGIFSLVLALGVARFAYTPLLPLMQSQAGLGIAEAGWLAAINYAGYLTGALAASLIGDLVLKDRLYRLGMVVALASTVMTITAANSASTSRASGLPSSVVLEWRKS